MEFQAVILAGGRGSRMYPLTEDCPKALLPVGNRPLIWYPVQLLENNGFQEALVIVREAHHRQISEVLERFDSTYGTRLKFSYYSIKDGSEDIGTADALRDAATRNLIKNDVILLSCDLMTSVRLDTLTEFHARHNCSLTALLVRPPNEDDTRKKSALVERDIIALAEDSKIVYFAAMADLDDDLTLSRSVIKRYPHMRVCSQLVDAHLYLLKKWVIDYLKKNKGISSVKGELVPHLVHHQGVAMEHTYTNQTKQDIQSSAQSSLDMLEQQIYSMSSFSGVHRESDAFTSQLVNCHAVLGDSELCTRVNTVPAYLDTNRMIPSHLAMFSITTSTPTSAEPLTPRTKGVSSDSLTDVGVQLGDKVSVKKSCIGQHCSIGDKSKIINSILMDHVNIGEGCTIQNCVVCSRARIEDKVTLKDCLVGANFTITKEADLRNETLVVGGGLHF